MIFKWRRPASGDSQREISEEAFFLENKLTLMENMYPTGEGALPSDLGAEDAGDSDSFSVLVTSSKQLVLPKLVCPGKFVKNSVNKAKVRAKKSHRL